MTTKREIDATARTFVRVMTEEPLTRTKLLENLLDMRNGEVLKEMDQRYQKGYRDAVDTIIKWYHLEREFKGKRE